MDLLLKGMVKDEPILVVGLIDTDTVEKARVIHDTYPTATAALGRVISGSILLSSILKYGQKVVLQVAGDGPLRGIVAETDWLCRVRGYIKRPHIHLGLKEGKLDVGRGIGKGFLNVLKDLGLREYYRGIVPLQTGEIATDIAYYLNVSEQIPAAVSLGVFIDSDNSVKASGGFMIHTLPNLEDEIIGFLERKLKEIPPVSTMILNGLSPKEIMEEAVGLPVEISESKEVLYHCPCTKDRVLDSIIVLGRKDIEELVIKGEVLNVQCEFCKKEYVVSQEELSSILHYFVSHN
ncbi:MAG: Hsp33 family molecular chaperone HslO [Nitrospirae bacterium]|nr:Hsp33 family molecular chaperone HslO [Nitrospirota bacterium]